MVTGNLLLSKHHHYTKGYVLTAHYSTFSMLLMDCQFVWKCFGFQGRTWRIAIIILIQIPNLFQCYDCFNFKPYVCLKSYETAFLVWSTCYPRNYDDLLAFQCMSILMLFLGQCYGGGTGNRSHCSRVKGRVTFFIIESKDNIFSHLLPSWLTRFASASACMAFNSL